MKRQDLVQKLEEMGCMARKILSSVEPEPSPETDAAWDREIRRRIARYDAGELQAIPAAEVFAELDRRLRR